jgi:Niemann-Pick C1 protein
VEQRVFLSVTGIFGVVLGIIVSYGFCSAIGLFFGPMHNVLPFLLLGIGIDDMFVIVQSWDTLSTKDQVSIIPTLF